MKSAVEKRVGFNSSSSSSSVEGRERSLVVRPMERCLRNHATLILYRPAIAATKGCYIILIYLSDDLTSPLSLHRPHQNQPIWAPTHPTIQKAKIN
mmetsp:Transcript_13889/g.22824  ORF Transcript_13889/g.22824 Transcript_13889/m.22824 type:complete len:96 (-) Transcript_13889:83-370(-)